MGAMTRKRRRTWVDGKGHGTEKEAAKTAGVSVSTVSDALKTGGRKVKGRMISGTPPEKSRAEIITRRRAAGILLRYPPGEGPLYQWSKRWT